MDFVDSDRNPQLRDIMKPIESTVTAPADTTTEQAYQLMIQKRVKKLPVVDTDRTLLGMYVWNDVRDDHKKRAMFSLDEEGRFLVGAAIGLADEDFERAKKLIAVGCKLLVLDSSHGACQPAVDLIAKIKTIHPRVQIIVGNVASYESAVFLLEQRFKPDGIKVGIGPGAICTTRRVTGHGVPQATAVYQVWRATQDCGVHVPIIADGGIRSSGDIVKAHAMGAAAVMIGSMLAGTDESPGQVVMLQGKKYKPVRGMGSRAAMAERSGSRARYSRIEKTHVTERLTSEQKLKIVPEGVEGLAEHRGSVEKVILELVGGISAGIAHSGAKTILDFQASAAMWLQSVAGMIEGNPHTILDIRS
eukprot:comp21518_c0_seq1/m.47007 comp21518_c0_seq1/g.47007  ORF comp21518_c0_seq1/g.47007 comp21518_c0_seq1/m.47007 type:complete len:361 (+) comp21518_c0_seq1:577-1659(+)